MTGMEGKVFNQTLAALRLSKMANGVSKIHGKVARKIWNGQEDICPITHITNSQNHEYWHDPLLDEALASGDDEALVSRKKEMKRHLFYIVADQTGKLFDPDVLTLVWARRFAEYKRADLITRDLARFFNLVNNSKRPIQIIWAGKPYPADYGAIATFNNLVNLSKKYPNLAVLTGYELALSKSLKQGSDIWLNNPRVPMEASGTSGMTAAMNGAVNLSTQDGWIPEFAKNGHNAFVLPTVDLKFSIEKQDALDRIHLLTTLESTILPLYYNRPKAWLVIVKNSMREVRSFFDSDRMADAYYSQLYSTKVSAGVEV